ncbi:hypothetical protein K438DRAFT_447545 [Mycena galopus ATCC 62051]|nr:hypothetical protein K438DRAFT_447545 [Mycena galopus ATCC 62051]
MAHSKAVQKGTSATGRSLFPELLRSLSVFFFPYRDASCIPFSPLSFQQLLSVNPISHSTLWGLPVTAISEINSGPESWATTRLFSTSPISLPIPVQKRPVLSSQPPSFPPAVHHSVAPSVWLRVLSLHLIHSLPCVTRTSRLSLCLRYNPEVRRTVRIQDHTVMEKYVSLQFRLALRFPFKGKDLFRSFSLHHSHHLLAESFAPAHCCPILFPGRFYNSPEHLVGHRESLST